MPGGEIKAGDRAPLGFVSIDLAGRVPRNDDELIIVSQANGSLLSPSSFNGVDVSFSV